MFDTQISRLTRPPLTFDRAAVLARNSPVPKESGVYAWFFREVPPRVPTNGCRVLDGLTLLYLGISPKAPPKNGKPPSTQTLWHRVRYHYQGNAEGSTLRLTLGCLLAGHLGIELRRVGSGKRMTFTANGETVLSEWMQDNAFVTWVTHPKPWIVEEALIPNLSLPLNIQGNADHQFYPSLKEVRAKAVERAREMPIAP